MTFNSGDLLSLGASVARVSTPLVLAALGGLFSERAGVVNIALEGVMLFGGFAAAVAAASFHSPWAGALAAVVAGVLASLFYGLFVIRWRSDQIVAGTAINLLAAGLTPFLMKAIYGSTTSTPSLALDLRFQSAPVWMAFLAVGLSAFCLRRLPFGLWIRFAGENPDALEAAGVSVTRTRWAALAVSGALAGLGGASLSIFLSSSFSRNMTAGRGFMALAALIFGKWRPVPAALACLLFGVFEAAQIRLQGVVLWGEDPVPVQFIQILPYLATLVVLAGFVGKSRAPKALGR
jgi:simple sugar transport system permease protein